MSAKDISLFSLLTAMLLVLISLSNLFMINVPIVYLLCYIFKDMKKVFLRSLRISYVLTILFFSLSLDFLLVVKLFAFIEQYIGCSIIINEEKYNNAFFKVGMISGLFSSFFSCFIMFFMPITISFFYFVVDSILFILFSMPVFGFFYFLTFCLIKNILNDIRGRILLACNLMFI